MADSYDSKDFTIVCKELGPGKGAPAVYEIKQDITGHLINCLKLRHMYNPELRYFVLKKENLDLVMKHLKFYTLKDVPAIIKELVVEL